MRAVDTNVIVRYLTDDDAEQSEKARALFAAGQLFVPTSVILEVEWVLRRPYDLSRAVIARLLRDLAGIAGVDVEDPSRLAVALDWFEAGLDFADALHLAAAAECAAFVSFDRRLARDAARLSAIPVVAP